MNQLTRAYRGLYGKQVVSLGIKKFQKLYPSAIPACTEYKIIAKVYTDGSCRFNGLSNARAGEGVFWGDGHKNNYSGKVDGIQDNNRAELSAAVFAITQAKMQGYRAIRIKTDSTFVIMAITKQLVFQKPSYEKYRDLMEKLDQLKEEIVIDVEYVRAHSGHHGNEQADRLAKNASKPNQVNEDKLAGSVSKIPSNKTENAKIASNPKKVNEDKLAGSVPKIPSNKTDKKKATKKQSKAQKKESEVEDGNKNKKK